MALDPRAGEAGDVGVGHAGRVLDAIGQAAQAGAEDQADPGLKVAAPANEGRRVSGAGYRTASA
jgi:hypothetical protein